MRCYTKTLIEVSNIKPGDIYLMTSPLLRKIKIMKIVDNKAHAMIIDHHVKVLIGKNDIYKIDYINQHMDKIESL